jgi:hypothetical protein
MGYHSSDLYLKIDELNAEIDHLTKTHTEELSTMQAEINQLYVTVNSLQQGLDQIYNIIPMIVGNEIETVEVNDTTHLHLVLK